MGEAWSNASSRSGALPDFPAGLDELLARPGSSVTGITQAPNAYAPLVSRALSEIVARETGPRLSPRRARAGGAKAVSPDPRVPGFVDALFEQGGRRCEAIAEAVFAEASDPQRMADSLFGPAATIIGERWVSDEADFLAVTVALARMQRMFSRMAADLPPTLRPDPARRLLLAPAPGEQHGFGLAIAEDAFRRAGWTVDRCGQGDGERVLRMAAACEYALIGLAVGSEHLLPALGPFVARLRSASRNGSAVLMAGGAAAVRDPRSLIVLGFDRIAGDASAGVAIAEAVVAQRAQGPHPQTSAH